MRPFLAQRGGRYDFFFESFKSAALQRYAGEQGGKRTTEAWHCLLAQYFDRLPIWKLDDGKPSLRKIAELPYHQTLGKLWVDLKATLTNITFLEAKYRCFSGYELEEDYRFALARLQGDHALRNLLTAFEERLRIDSHIISHYQELLFPQLYNHLTWLDMQENGPIHTICEQSRPHQQNWLRMIQDPRPESHSSTPSVGHHGVIKAIAITSDDQLIVSGSTDKTIKVWEMGSGQLLHSLEGHINSINALAITPDSKRLVSGSSDNTIKVWNLENGQLQRSLEGHTRGVISIALTPDGHRILSGSGDQTIKVWELMSGRLLLSIKGHSKTVSAVAVTKDGRQIISRSADKTIKVWDLESGKLLHSYDENASKDVLVFAFSDQHIVTGSVMTIKAEKSPSELHQEALEIS